MKKPHCGKFRGKLASTVNVHLIWSHAHDASLGHVRWQFIRLHSAVGQVLHSLDTTIRDDFAVVCIQYFLVEDDCKSKQTALS